MNKPRLTDEQRARGRELDSSRQFKAYHRDEQGRHLMDYCIWVERNGNDCVLASANSNFDFNTDMDFICHAANNYTAALDEIEDLNKELKARHLVEELLQEVKRDLQKENERLKSLLAHVREEE